MSIVRDIKDMLKAADRIIQNGDGKLTPPCKPLPKKPKRKKPKEVTT